MWKKIKENWKTYLLLILSALFGADQAQEFGLVSTAPATEQEAPENYDARKNTWTVVADFSQVKTVGGGAIPSFEFEDGLGREVVRVESRTDPVAKDVIYAFYGDAPPAKIRAVIVSATPPPGWKVEKSIGPEKE